MKIYVGPTELHAIRDMGRDGAKILIALSRRGHKVVMDPMGLGKPANTNALTPELLETLRL